MATEYMSIRRGDGEKPLTSTWHFSEAMRLLRLDLDAASGPQDPSIAVVVSFAIHARLRGSMRESGIHLLGLKRMLELRPGGLAALRTRAPELGNKIRRADIELAMLTGTSTIFGSLILPAASHVIPLEPGQRSPPALPPPFNEACPPMQYAMHDGLSLCSYAGRADLEPFQYQDMVNSVLQRLLDYAPLGDVRPTELIDNICQLGLIAFMTTVIYRVGQKRSIYMVRASKLLHEQIFACNNSSKVSLKVNQHPPLRLWLAFIYAFSAPQDTQGSESTTTAIQNIQEATNILGLKTWEDTLSHLTRYPWVAPFHDEPGKKLWASTNNIV